MIFRDEYGYLVNEVYDGFDSTVRAGIYMMCTKNTDTFDISTYENPEQLGWLRRHPIQKPDDNVLNFSRDQLIPFVVGLNAIGKHDIVKRVFYAHLKRLFICQNFQHDEEGTWKYPWPHKSTWKEDNGRWLLFDFADILLPNQIWVLIKSARLYAFYPFILIAFPFFILNLLNHCLLSKHYEENQFIAEASTYGAWAIKLYRKLKKNWVDVNRSYWYSKNEHEYAVMIERFVNET